MNRWLCRLPTAGVWQKEFGFEFPNRIVKHPISCSALSAVHYASYEGRGLAALIVRFALDVLPHQYISRWANNMMTRTKTGPKPKPFSELIRKNAASCGYTVVRASDRTGTAVVCCLKCQQTHTTKKSYRIDLCSCVRKRPFYGVERTTKSHKQELIDRGLDSEYKVLSKVEKDVFRYRHLACGRVFRSHMGLLWQNRTVAHFCKACRQDALDGHKRSLDLVLNSLSQKMPSLKLVSDFVPGITQSITVRDSKCGHQFDLAVFKVTEKSKHSSMLRCPVCHPRSVWFEFEVAGKKFKTRSRVEQRFVEFLVTERGINPADIHYEPKDHVAYRCPVSGKRKQYIPDFRVKNVLVEVKDLNSLGVGGSYHWQSKEEALIVNRAKCEAANRKFADYRVYVLLRSGRFRKVNDFWSAQEQKRLNLI